MGRWDFEASETTRLEAPTPLTPTINDEGEDAPDKKGALLFVLWSAFMMVIGVFIGLTLSGHLHLVIN